MSNSVTWHDHAVTRDERAARFGQRGVTLWLTGLSASGKSTIANAVDTELTRQGIRSYVLDGDNLRTGLNSDLGFSPEDRRENIRRFAEVAKLFTDAGVVTIVALISPYRADRDAARGVHE